MACTWVVKACGTDAAALRAAASDALDEVDRVDRLMSHYRPESPLSRLNREAASGPVRVEPELFDFVAECLRYGRESGGAFDVTVGPLMKAWGLFEGDGRVPGARELAEARAAVGSRHVALDPVAGTIRFDRPGVALDLGGIAKGYAVDRVVALLRRRGVTAALVNGGGSSIYGLGSPAGRDAWKVKVQDPVRRERVALTVPLRNRALSVSGASGRGFERDGVFYGHIMDPRRGSPVRGRLSSPFSAKPRRRGTPSPTPSSSRASSGRGATSGIAPRPGSCSSSPRQDERGPSCASGAEGSARGLEVHDGAGPELGKGELGGAVARREVLERHRAGAVPEGRARLPAPLEADPERGDGASAVVEEMQAARRRVAGEDAPITTSLPKTRSDCALVRERAPDLEGERARGRPASGRGNSWVPSWTLSAACRGRARGPSGRGGCGAREGSAPRPRGRPSSTTADVGDLGQVRLRAARRGTRASARRLEVRGIDLEDGVGAVGEGLGRGQGGLPRGEIVVAVLRRDGSRRNRQPFATIQGLRVAEATSGRGADPGRGERLARGPVGRRSGAGREARPSPGASLLRGHHDALDAGLLQRGRRFDTGSGPVEARQGGEKEREAHTTISLHLDARLVATPEAEAGRELHVPGLADHDVHVRVGVARRARRPPSGSAASGPRSRSRPRRFRLLSMMSRSRRSMATGSVPKRICLRVEDVPRVRAKGPPCQTP